MVQFPWLPDLRINGEAIDPLRHPYLQKSSHDLQVASITPPLRKPFGRGPTIRSKKVTYESPMARKTTDIHWNDPPRTHPRNPSNPNFFKRSDKELTLIIGGFLGDEILAIYRKFIVAISSHEIGIPINQSVSWNDWRVIFRTKSKQNPSKSELFHDPLWCTFFAADKNTKELVGLEFERPFWRFRHFF